MNQLLESPIADWHDSHGAKMTSFAGWRMPLQYLSGPIAEHRMVRKSAGVFDTSHMGRFEFRGEGPIDAARDFLDGIVSSDLAGLPSGRSRYGLLLREDGGIIDDVFVYHVADRWLVVVNAANTAKDWAWIRDRAAGPSLQIADLTSATSMIALQGPEAERVLAAAGWGSAPPRLGCVEGRLIGADCVVARTGYTGEDGFEIIAAAAAGTAVWEGLLAGAAAAGVDCLPTGLAARDSLRFEPGYSLYGHEIDETVNPVEAGLGWACHLERDFVGRDAVRRALETGPARVLVTLVMEEPAVPRAGYAVEAEGKKIGTVVSGMFCPTLEVYAANAFVPVAHSGVGTALNIDIRGSAKPAVIVKRPLYHRRKK